MVGLTKKDIYSVVNRYIGVCGGYLGDFSYHTHAEFYGEYCDLDIDPFVYDGTTRERFIRILERADPRTQATILKGILEKYPVGSDELRTPESFVRVQEMIARCLSGAGVEAPELRITSEVVQRAIADAETLMQSGGPTSAVDRVHTALHGYLMAACDDQGIAYARDPSILDLFKLLKEQHPRLRALGAHQGPIVQVLRSLGAVMDALNPARNRGSVAHPNEQLLDSDEAMLFINAARTVLQYLDVKLRVPEMSWPVDRIPVAKNKRTSYENFVAECPWCGQDSIFNRASDLCTFEPIDGRDMACLSAGCGRLFRIGGDRVNNAHETLVFDCYELIERKHFMACILSLVQAYEVFFSLFFRVEFLYKPFAADLDQGIDELNRLAVVLENRLKDNAFARMRALFLQRIVAAPSPKNLAEAEKMVMALPTRRKDIEDPEDSAIDSLADAKLVPLLKSLKATDIHTRRNDVVHKRAYRPTAVEVQKYLGETESILFPLTDHLDLDDDINRYVMALP